MFIEKKLKNGLTLITSPMSCTKTVTALVMIGTGSKYEDKDQGGISHFVEHMFFQGTKKRGTALAISSELDSIGAEYNAFTGKEYTGYWIKSESSKITKALEIVSDMLINPKLDEAEIAKEKGVIIEELNMYQDNPLMFMEDVFEQCLYGDSPAGRDTIGTKKTIASFKQKDFVNYINNQYCAKNTIVCITGNLANIKKNLKKNDLSDLVSKYFNQKNFLSRGVNFNEKERVKEEQTNPQIKIHYKKTDQAHLSLGVRAFAYSDKKKTAAKLMAILLGGSMSSRMFINLRDKHGLAYYVRSENETYTDHGYLTTRAGVPTGKIEQAIKIILSEYKKLKEKLVDAKELQKVKDLITGRFALQLESSDNIANWYARQAVLSAAISRAGKHKEKIETPEGFIKELKKIKATDIKKVANEIFVNKNLNLAIIGPYENGKKFEKILNL